MKNVDERYYTQLSAHERVKLTIAALARNDKDELSRLKRTCERKQYIMLDREYTIKLENLTRLATYFSELQNYFFIQMLIFSARIALGQDKHDLLRFHEAYINQIANIKSLYEALNTFCESRQLNSSHFMEAFKTNFETILNFVTEKNWISIEPNKEFSAHLTQRFLEIWNE